MYSFSLKEHRLLHFAGEGEISDVRPERAEDTQEKNDEPKSVLDVQNRADAFKAETDALKKMLQKSAGKKEGEANDEHSKKADDILKEFEDLCRSTENIDEKRQELQKLYAKADTVVQELKDDVEKAKVKPEAKPKNHKERLEQNLRDGFDRFKNAKDDGEKWSAMWDNFLTMIEYWQRTWDKSLNQKLEIPKEPGKESPAKENASKPEVTPEKKLVKELESVTKEKGEKVENEKPATTLENIDGLRKEKREKVDSNMMNIEKIDKKIADAKKANEGLINGKATIEIQIEKLRGDEKNADEITALQTELTKIEDQLKAGQKARETLDAQRDGLATQNKALEKEIVILNGMNNDTEGAKKKIGELLDAMRKIWKGMPNISVAFDPMGTLTITMSGLSPQQEKALPNTIENNGGIVKLVSEQVIQVVDYLKRLTKNNA